LDCYSPAVAFGHAALLRPSSRFSAADSPAFAEATADKQGRLAEARKLIEELKKITPPKPTRESHLNLTEIDDFS
jgi:hypothetical protein